MHSVRRPPLPHLRRADVQLPRRVQVPPRPRLPPQHLHHQSPQRRALQLRLRLDPDAGRLHREFPNQPAAEPPGQGEPEESAAALRQARSVFSAPHGQLGEAANAAWCGRGVGRRQFPGSDGVQQVQEQAVRTVRKLQRPQVGRPDRERRAHAHGRGGVRQLVEDRQQEGVQEQPARGHAAPVRQGHGGPTAG